MARVEVSFEADNDQRNAYSFVLLEALLDRRLRATCFKETDRFGQFKNTTAAVPLGTSEAPMSSCSRSTWCW